MWRLGNNQPLSTLCNHTSEKSCADRQSESTIFKTLSDTDRTVRFSTMEIFLEGSKFSNGITSSQNNLVIICHKVVLFIKYYITNPEEKSIIHSIIDSRAMEMIGKNRPHFRRCLTSFSSAQNWITGPPNYIIFWLYFMCV